VVDVNLGSEPMWRNEMQISKRWTSSPLTPTRSGPLSGLLSSGGWRGWGLLFGLSLAVSGCGTGEDGFSDDPNPNDDENTVSSCAPEIADLGFAKGTDQTLGSFLRASFSFALGTCGGSIDSGTVRIQVVNLDAADPNAPEASAWYELPTESSYVLKTSGEDIISVDFSVPDETTTYEFNVKLIDSLGYASNKLTEDVVYQDVLDEV